VVPIEIPKEEEKLPEINFQNQFDLKMYMSSLGDQMDLDCVLNDIRFVFAVPTA
jgi:hypothetical protein